MCVCVCRCVCRCVCVGVCVCVCVGVPPTIRFVGYIFVQGFVLNGGLSTRSHSVYVNGSENALSKRLILTDLQNAR